jgi:hypothetical protein
MQANKDGTRVGQNESAIRASSAEDGTIGFDGTPPLDRRCDVAYGMHSENAAARVSSNRRRRVAVEGITEFSGR